MRLLQYMFNIWVNDLKLHLIILTIMLRIINITISLKDKNILVYNYEI